MMSGQRQKQGFGTEHGCLGPCSWGMRCTSSLRCINCARPPNSAASLQPAHQSALHDLGSELCMSTECHLVGFCFIIHISLKKLPFLKKYSIVHRFDACPRGENKLINANFPYCALSQQLLSTMFLHLPSLHNVCIFPARYQSGFRVEAPQGKYCMFSLVFKGPRESVVLQGE